MNKPTRESKKSANYALILNGIHAIGVSQSGKAINRDASFISRLKSGEKKISIDEIVELFDAWGLELVEQASDKVQVDRILYKALVELSDNTLGSAVSDNAPKINISQHLYESLLQLSNVGIKAMLEQK